MPTPTDITTGTISLANNGTTVTGVGTSWLASDIRQGDLFIWIEGGDGFWQPIVDSVESNTEITLEEVWEGPTLTGVPYRLRYQWDSSRVSAQSRQLIELLGNGNIQALAGLDGTGGDKGVMLDGTGSAATFGLTAFARTLLDDTNAATMRATLGLDAPVFLSAGDNLNTARAYGLYYAIAGTSNLPPGETEGWFWQVPSLGPSFWAQEFIGVFSGVHWRRSNVNEVIGPWRSVADASTLMVGTLPDGRISTSLTPDKAFRRGNVLGTVSQSAGVPTGAIIERGSNAQGSYVRYADGTQICWFKFVYATANINTASGAIFYVELLGPFAYPAAFSSDPITSVQVSSPTWAVYSATNGVGTQTQWPGVFGLANVAATGISVTIDRLAIGRWF